MAQSIRPRDREPTDGPKHRRRGEGSNDPDVAGKMLCMSRETAGPEHSGLSLRGRKSPHNFTFETPTRLVGGPTGDEP
jgi:hypothetical protein